jgi:hypothetical protein
MNPELWDVLHDGAVTRVVEGSSGTVIISVEIGYLRDRFPPPGEGFIITLINTDVLRFEAHDENPVITGAEIAAEKLWILSGREEGGCIKVSCGHGDLVLRYERADLALDTGQPLDFDQLSAECEHYWEEFGSNSEA